MEIEKQKAIIEAILFAAGRVIKINELMGILELSSDDVVTIIDSMKEEYKNSDRGIEIIRVEDGYQLTTKKEMYEYLYPIFDKRSKPNLTQATTPNFLKMFGMSSLEELPELPKYKLDENQQLVIDDIIPSEDQSTIEKEEIASDETISEAPMPERENVDVIKNDNI